MEKRLISIGGEYGYREHPRRHNPLEHIRVIEQTRSQWKVEWLEPNPGLIDYVKSIQIVVPWKERQSFLRDEQIRDQLADTSTWPGRGDPLSDAVDTVLDSTGEDIWIGSYGILKCESEVLERVAARGKIEIQVEPSGFVDSEGQVHLPFSVAVRLAQAFAATESQTVLFTVDMVEQKYESEARDRDDNLFPLVQHWKAGWALCRQWAGFDQALAQRDAEIERLRRVIEDIRYELRRAGQDKLAATVDRRLGRT